MSYIEYKKREELIITLVEQERTGSTSELSERIGVSQRTIKRIISNLRNDNHQIVYSRKKMSYIYED